MEASELLELIGNGETTKVQFKRDVNNAVSIAQEMVAFSNTKGGLILIGVDDKTGNILELTYQDIQRINNLLSTAAQEHVKSPIFIITETIHVNDKRVIVVNVSEGMDKPHTDKDGVVWLKNGADKRKVVSKDELSRLLQSSGNILADEMEIYGTSISDIEKSKFSQYFKKEFDKTFREKGLTYDQALKAKRVLRNSHITLAGLLFFGKEPQNIKPAFTIKPVSYFGNDISGSEYRSKPGDFQGTIPELFEKAMNFLSSNLHHVQKGQNFNSIGILEVSKIALEELLQNALVHRDYFKNSPIRLLIFDNRIELISPGKLPNSLTVEDIKYGNPVIRNNQLVSFSTHTLPYSGLGSGIKRALEKEPNIEFINDVEGEQFIVKIPRPEKK